MKRFTNESLIDIIDYLEKKLNSIEIHGIVEFEVLNPDIKYNLYSGESVKTDSKEYIYRGYNSWINLAQYLFCKMLTPKIISKEFIVLSFFKLDVRDSFHKSKLMQDEKYGIESEFIRVNKNDESSFLTTYMRALKSVNINSKKRVLNLGINKADEFDVISKMTNSSDIEFVGVDFCESAINIAKERFNSSNFTFYKEDINKIDSLNLGKFDLIISVGTLQSTTLDFKPFFMSLVQNYLEDKGSIILGFPNCRWIDGEMIYGAKAPNYAYSELSILFNDVIFCKKYLQQKKYRVTITGRDYIFLTATSIKK